MFIGTCHDVFVCYVYDERQKFADVMSNNYRSAHMKISLKLAMIVHLIIIKMKLTAKWFMTPGRMWSNTLYPQELSTQSPITEHVDFPQFG